MAEIHDARDAILKAMQEEQREIRAEQRRMLDLLQQIVQTQGRQGSKIEEMAVGLSGIEARLSKKMGETRDELATIIKAELGGSMAHVETRLEQRQDRGIAQMDISIETAQEAIADLRRSLEALAAMVESLR